MSDQRSRTGDAPGDEGPDQTLTDPTAGSSPDEDDMPVPGDAGATAAAARELDAEDESAPTRSE